MSSKSRFIARRAPGMPTTDGAGVKLRRVIGTPHCDMIDPFLMLDEFGSDDPEAWIAGFPDHPHRGFETVTIMLEGRVRHGDSVGNSGVIEAGDVQWMTAGRGIIHSEMPEMAEGRLRGFQLWVNLPANLKMTAPRYQDIPAARIPSVEADGVRIRVIAGTLEGVRGPAEAHVPVRLLDMSLAAGAAYEVDAPAGRGCFLYVAEGALDGRDGLGRAIEVPAGTLAVVRGEGGLALKAGATTTRLLYAEGKPIGEPVARHGPFVMNTRAELIEAFEDYNAGRLAGA